MDMYKKLKCVQGLIMSLDEQIYRVDSVRKDLQSDQAWDMLVNRYHDAIVEILNKDENNAKAS